MPSNLSRPAVVDVFDAFDSVMRSRGWRWYVFGAQAVVAYGRPRMTADVDVTVELAKILAGRRKDLEDVRGVLLERWESINLANIEGVLGILEDALGDAKLKRRFYRLLRQVRNMLGSER